MDFSKGTRENFNLGNTPPLEVALRSNNVSSVCFWIVCLHVFGLHMVWNWLWCRCVDYPRVQFPLHVVRSPRHDRFISYFFLSVDSFLLALIVARWKDNFMRLFVIGGVYGSWWFPHSVKLNGVLGIVICSDFIYVFYLSTDRSFEPHCISCDVRVLSPLCRITIS